MDYFKKAKEQSWYQSPITIGYLEAVTNIKAVEKIISGYDEQIISKLIPDREEWQYYTMTFTKSFQKRLSTLLKNLHNDYTDVKSVRKSINKSTLNNRYKTDIVDSVSVSIMIRSHESNRTDALNIFHEINTSRLLEFPILLK